MILPLKQYHQLLRDNKCHFLPLRRESLWVLVESSSKRSPIIREDRIDLVVAAWTWLVASIVVAWSAPENRNSGFLGLLSFWCFIYGSRILNWHWKRLSGVTNKRSTTPRQGSRGISIWPPHQTSWEHVITVTILICRLSVLLSELARQVQQYEDRICKLLEGRLYTISSIFRPSKVYLCLRYMGRLCWLWRMM